jgi:hypothetical protein
MKRFFKLCALVTLTACATAYQQRGFSGGFAETQLGEETFQVSFNGNGYTSAERASDFALLRCAEVVRDHGFPFFIVVSGESGTRRSTYTTPTTTTGSATVSGSTVTGTATTTGGQTYVTVKPSTRNIVVGLKTKPPTGLVFEAEYVIRSLRAKYQI